MSVGKRLARLEGHAAVARLGWAARYLAALATTDPDERLRLVAVPLGAGEAAWLRAAKLMHGTMSGPAWLLEKRHALPKLRDLYAKGGNPDPREVWRVIVEGERRTVGALCDLARGKAASVSAPWWLEDAAGQVIRDVARDWNFGTGAWPSQECGAGVIRWTEAGGPEPSMT